MKLIIHFILIRIYVVRKGRILVERLIEVGVCTLCDESLFFNLVDTGEWLQIVV